MKCYNCGANLSKHNFCVNCRANVVKYKKAIALSNLFYNDGLEKAKVRDLSGATVSLHQCLKLNKNHIDARNLLGLIYYETGEVVLALKEWVISKNLKSDKNIADEYLELVQNNASRIENIEQTATKFNQALEFCKKGSTDVALIQVRKVLSMNGRYLQARQLLALLYINKEEWQKAKKELLKCQKIDCGNVITLKYLKEVNTVLNKEDTNAKQNGHIAEETVSYHSGNELIIQPLNVKESKLFSSIFHIIIGVFIGFLVAWFLVLPARINSTENEINEDLKVLSEQLDGKTATISELEQKISVLTTEQETMLAEIETYVGTDGTLENMNHLIEAITVYLETPDDIALITEYLDTIDSATILEKTSETFTILYQSLLTKVGPTISVNYYNLGVEAYNNEQYEDSITYLEKSYSYDSSNGDALFSLGNSYRKNEQYDQAILIYEEVVELFPGTNKAVTATNYLSDLQ